MENIPNKSWLKWLSENPCLKWLPKSWLFKWLYNSRFFKWLDKQEWFRRVRNNECFRWLFGKLWDWFSTEAGLKKLIWIETAILFLLGLYLMGPAILWNMEIIISLPDKCASLDIADTASCIEITRNFGWGIWMTASIGGVSFGLWLTWQGRQIQRDQWKTQEKQWETQDKQWNTQHTSHLQERFEKATDMLGNEAELVRIGGCRSLMNLGKSDESMKSQCVQLLFAFINAQVKDDEEDTFEALSGNIKPFCSDIQQAIASFSAIYRHYNRVGVDDDLVELPKRFWKNQWKPTISLIKANLQRVDLDDAELCEANFKDVNLRQASLRGANLRRANLRRANLLVANLRGANLRRANLRYANLSMASLLETDLHTANLQNANLRKTRLKGANLARADLRRADISAASLQEAENLSKEQILSAIWGYAKYGSRHQPKLPEGLTQDEDIKKWLETPTYDEREKSQKSPRKTPNNPSQ